jgi:hypothetical protein
MPPYFIDLPKPKTPVFYYNDGRCAYCREPLSNEEDDAWIGVFGDYCCEECEELASRGLNWSEKPIYYCIELEVNLVQPLR